MCHFITATLPKETNLDAVATIFEQFKFGFQTIRNPHLEDQLPVGEHYILTTRNRCDCGTALGSLHRNSENPAPTYQRELQRFRQQGWSEAKINRWLKEKEQARERAESEAQQVSEADVSQVTHWMSFLTAILQPGYVTRIGLLLHRYNRAVTSERIQLKKVVTQPLPGITPDYLLTLEEDFLYNFTSSR